MVQLGECHGLTGDKKGTSTVLVENLRVRGGLVGRWRKFSKKNRGRGVRNRGFETL